LAAGTELLRRQVLAEFPDTEKGRLWSRLRARAGRDGAAGPAAAGGGVADIERLVSLHRDGELTDEEFAAAKARLLGAAAQSPS
ncbi:MAG TPA: SHOCT domain-containing protein, partial [Solirubrobacterales bacterium]